MFNDIGKIDSIFQPDLLKANRDRGSSSGNNKGETPSPRPEETKKEETEEQPQSPHLLDVRI